MHVDEKIRLAQTAQGEALWRLVRDSHPDVIYNAVLNRNLTEEMAVFIAQKKSSSAEILGIIANDIRFKNSNKLKRALCRHPKTPQKITLSLLKFLRIFDLGDMTRDQNIPITVRQKIEFILAEKIPSLPSGNKIALAKRSNSATVTLLMERGDQKVISVCLDSPTLTEGHLWKLINKTATKPLVIRMIAEHPKWSLRYSVRYALIRNFHAPLRLATGFIRDMKTADLRDLYEDRNLPTSTRPFIYRELMERGEAIEVSEGTTYELADDEDNRFPDINEIA